MSTIECVKQTLAAITNLTDNKFIIEMAEFCIERVDHIKEIEANTWISVEDRLPEYGDVYLFVIKDDGTGVPCVISRFMDGFFIDVTDQCTHWMPLPAPPEPENDNQ